MEQVTHYDLVKALVKHPMDIFETLSLNKIDIWHAATGIAGESGELFEGIFLYKEGNATYDEARENLMEESGDIYFYTEQLLQRTKIVVQWDLINIFAQKQVISPDMALSYAGQVVIYGSQVLDTVKKYAVYNHELPSDKLLGQLVLMLEYVVTLGLMFGFSREQALEHNIAKLSKRYNGLKYTDKAAEERADKVPVVERNYFGQDGDHLKA